MFLLVLRNAAACKPSARMQGKIAARILQSFVLVCTVSVSCHSQTRPFLCRGGFGRFSSQFSTGVTVSVAAPKKDGFATRACDARLKWGGNELPVAQGVWGIDIDVRDQCCHLPCASSTTNAPVMSAPASTLFASNIDSTISMSTFFSLSTTVAATNSRKLFSPSS